MTKERENAAIKITQILIKQGYPINLAAQMAVRLMYE